MDPSSFKTAITKRGFKYNYAFVPAAGSPRDTILFVHGFPSTSFEWRNQVVFFREAGFSLIVPDMLGTGETDKPTDYTAYKFSEMAGDVVDILDAEKVDKVIVVGHDWGSVLVSRLASYYPERFKAYAFLSIGYSATFAGFEYEAFLASIKRAVGYETYGYWEFFVEDGAHKLIEEHLESWLSLIYPVEPEIWKDEMSPRGAMKARLLADRRSPFVSWLKEEDLKYIMELIRRDGIDARLNWYKSFVRGIGSEDKNIPQGNLVVAQPVLYIACQRDYACAPALSKATIGEYCKNVTIKDFDTGHWVQLEAPDAFNATLLEWINGSTA